MEKQAQSFTMDPSMLRLVQNPSIIPELDLSVEDAKTLAEGFAIALGEAANRNSALCEKIAAADRSFNMIFKALKRITDCFSGVCDVVSRCIDLLKQNPQNSNWSPATSAIKPFSRQAKNYANQIGSLKKRFQDAMDTADVALTLYDPALRLVDRKDKSGGKQGTGTSNSNSAGADGSNGSDKNNNPPKTDSDGNPGGNTAPSDKGGSSAGDDSAPAKGDSSTDENRLDAAGKTDSGKGNSSGSDGVASAEDGSNSNGNRDTAAGNNAAAGEGNGEGEGSGKKPGGPLNHRGCNKTISGEPDEEVICLPEMCLHCTKRKACLEAAHRSDRRDVCDIDFHIKTTAYYAGRVFCSKTGKIVTGKHPKGVKARFQYGENLQALIICLFALGYVSIERIQGFVRDVLGIHMSTGTIMNFINRAGERGVAFWDYIRCMVRNARIAGSDETSAFVKGDGEILRYWVHTVVTNLFTYLYCSAKRGYDAILEDGVLVDFLGTLVHDCWYAYFKIDTANHALCGAHCVRELRGVLDRDPEQAWAQKMIDLLGRMLERKRDLLKQALEKGLSEEIGPDTEKPHCSPEELEEFFKEFDEILKEGFAFNDYPYEPEQKKKGRCKNTKTVNLLLRLRDHKEDWLRFITDLSVPFTNNWSETSLRSGKIHQHVSHFTRTRQGLTIRLILSSITQSAQKHKISGFEAIKMVIAGVTPEELFGHEIPEEVRNSMRPRAASVVIPGKKPSKADVAGGSCLQEKAMGAAM